jgi:hypothetical protein
MMSHLSTVEKSPTSIVRMAPPTPYRSRLADRQVLVVLVVQVVPQVSVVAGIAAGAAGRVVAAAVAEAAGRSKHSNCIE